MKAPRWSVTVIVQRALEELISAGSFEKKCLVMPVDAGALGFRSRASAVKHFARYF